MKKGEKGIMILAPIVVKRRTEAGAVGESQERETVLVGFTKTYVWDESQTDGKPLPESSSVTGDPGSYTDRVKSYIAQLGIALEYSSDIAPAKGLSHGGKITLLPDLSPAESLSVLVHELLHRNGRRAETTRTVRETEAESVAFVVCQAIGLQTNRSSVDYIQLWNGDKQTLTESLHFVQQTASQILSAISPGE